MGIVPWILDTLADVLNPANWYAALIGGNVGGGFCKAEPWDDEDSLASPPSASSADWPVHRPLTGAERYLARRYESSDEYRQAYDSVREAMTREFQGDPSKVWS